MATIEIEAGSIFKKSQIISLLARKDPSLTLHPPGKRKSAIWSHFNVVFINGTQTEFACCKTCTGIVTASNKIGTNGLSKHPCMVGASNTNEPQKSKIDVFLHPKRSKSALQSQPHSCWLKTCDQLVLLKDLE